MKRIIFILLAFLLLLTFACSEDGGNDKKDNEIVIDEVGINFRDKTIGQILPGFPEDIIELKNVNELYAVYHQYFYPNNDFKNMTGAERDTCYAVEYVANDIEAVFAQYLKDLDGKVDGDDPDRFEVVKGDYLIRFRKHPNIDMMYINCYTNVGSEYKEAILDEVVSRYSPENVGLVMMEKKILIKPDSTSYVFDYSYKGEDEPILAFYRQLIEEVNESMRNETTYFEDNIVGTELGQFVSVSHKYNTVSIQEITYQE